MIFRGVVGHTSQLCCGVLDCAYTIVYIFFHCHPVREADFSISELVVEEEIPKQVRDDKGRGEIPL